MKRLLLALMLALLPTPALAYNQTLGCPGGMDVFLLIGQSNMSGYTPLPSARASVPNVILFGNDDQCHYGQEPTDESTGQVDSVSYDGISPGGPLGYSSAENFGIAVAQATGHTVGLVPCAKGGSAVTEWQRDSSRSSLYGSCLYRARALGGTVKGIIYWQGEAEAIGPPSAIVQPSAWFQFFSAFIYDIRLDLGNMALPIVLVNVGGTAQYAPQAYLASVRAQQVQAAATLQNVALIEASNQPTVDGEHLTAAGQDVMSGREFNAYMGLIGQPQAAPTVAPATPVPASTATVAPTATSTIAPTRTSTPIPAATATPVASCTADENTFATVLFSAAPGTTTVAAGATDVTVVGQPPCSLVHAYDVANPHGYDYPASGGIFAAWAQSTGHLSANGNWQ